MKSVNLPPKKMPWAIHPGHLYLPRRVASSLRQHIHPLGRGKAEAASRQLGVFLQARERQRGVLAKVVFHVHTQQLARLEAHAHALERAVAVLGRGFQPIQTIADALVFQLIVFFQVVIL